MIDILHGLQILFVCAWGLPLVLFAKFAWRKAAGPCDTLRAAVWVASLSIVVFPIRWLVMGSSIAGMPALELAVWSSLYVLGTLASLFLTYATTEVCRGRS